MSDATLWINDANDTAIIAGTNVSYTMPLWVFNVMRDIIMAEAEKKVEVTHLDFDTQQELLDKYRAENAKLLELVRDYDHCNRNADCDRCEYGGTASTHCPISPCFPDIDELRELGDGGRAMSITDELREWAKGSTLSSWTAEHLTAIADRIDAEYDKALNSVDDAYDSGYNVGYDEGFASADDWLAQHEDAMAEHGLVRLPLDADGVPWHVGDMTENKHTVQEMCLNKHGWHFVGTVNDIDPSIHTHYQQPTVEDVLLEFYVLAVRGKEAHAEDVDGDVLAEYAAKLRLAEGEVDDG